jgi:hypothetical protein
MLARYQIANNKRTAYSIKSNEKGFIMPVLNTIYVY